MKERRVERVGTAGAGVYLNKAEQFLESAEDSLASGRWDAGGLEAIHAGISFADAVLAAAAGVRSREADHAVLVTLLEERVAAFSGASRRQLVGLLSSKNMVEYEHRLVTEVEAVHLVDQARRLGRWARRLVKK